MNQSLRPYPVPVQVEMSQSLRPCPVPVQDEMSQPLRPCPVPVQVLLSQSLRPCLVPEQVVMNQSLRPCPVPAQVAMNQSRVASDDCTSPKKRPRSQSGEVSSTNGVPSASAWLQVEHEDGVTAGSGALLPPARGRPLRRCDSPDGSGDHANGCAEPARSPLSPGVNGHAAEPAGPAPSTSGGGVWCEPAVGAASGGSGTTEAAPWPGADGEAEPKTNGEVQDIRKHPHWPNKHLPREYTVTRADSPGEILWSRWPWSR